MELRSNVKTVEQLEAICKSLVEQGLAEDVTDSTTLDAIPKGFKVKKYQVFVRDPEDFFNLSPKRVNVRFWYLMKHKVEGIEEDISLDKAIVKISTEGLHAILQSLTVLSLLKDLNIHVNGDKKINTEAVQQILEKTLQTTRKDVEINE